MSQFELLVLSAGTTEESLLQFWTYSPHELYYKRIFEEAKALSSETKVAVLPFTLRPPLRILNSVISWSLPPRLTPPSHSQPVLLPCF